MDFLEGVEGLEISDELKAKVNEAIKARTEALLESERNKAKEIIQTRDSAKRKLRELEEKLKDVNLDELKEIKTKYDTLVPEIEEYKTKLTAQEERIKLNLKERFSDEKWEIVKDLPISKLEDLAKVEVPKKGVEPNKTAPKGNETIITKQEYLSLSQDERAKLDKATVFNSMKTW